MNSGTPRERVIELNTLGKPVHVAVLEYRQLARTLELETIALQEQLDAAEVVFAAWRKYGFGHYHTFVAFQKYEIRSMTPYTPPTEENK